MTDRHKPYDVVILNHGVPENGIAAGTKAVVVEVYEEPAPGYEVEVVDDQTGETLWLGSVKSEDISAA